HEMGLDALLRTAGTVLTGFILFPPIREDAPGMDRAPADTRLDADLQQDAIGARQRFHVPDLPFTSQPQSLVHGVAEAFPLREKCPEFGRNANLAKKAPAADIDQHSHECVP